MTSGVICDSGGGWLMSQVRDEVCFHKFAAFSSFLQNIGLYKRKHLRTVSIHMSGEIHTMSQMLHLGAFFPSSWAEGNKHCLNVKKQKQKKTGSFFPEMERFWCRLLFFCVS